MYLLPIYENSAWLEAKRNEVSLVRMIAMDTNLPGTFFILNLKVLQLGNARMGVLFPLWVMGMEVSVRPP